MTHHTAALFCLSHVQAVLQGRRACLPASDPHRPICTVLSGLKPSTVLKDHAVYVAWCASLADEAFKVHCMYNAREPANVL